MHKSSSVEITIVLAEAFSLRGSEVTLEDVSGTLLTGFALTVMICLAGSWVDNQT